MSWQDDLLYEVGDHVMSTESDRAGIIIQIDLDDPTLTYYVRHLPQEYYADCRWYKEWELQLAECEIPL